ALLPLKQPRRPYDVAPMQCLRLFGTAFSERVQCGELGSRDAQAVRAGPRYGMPTSLLGFAGPASRLRVGWRCYCPPLTSSLGHAGFWPTARAVPSRFHSPQSFSWTGAEMSNPPIYEMLAQAFAREGVDTLFSLMGDGNMHWATAMSKIDGMRVFHVRHE